MSDLTSNNKSLQVNATVKKMGKTMSSSNLISIMVVVLLIVEESTICCLSKNNITFECVPEERKALLRLKSSFSDDSSFNRLSSWKNNSDCCTWQGIGCDEATKHVVKLDLRNRAIDEEYGDPDPESNMLTSDTIDSPLGSPSLDGMLRSDTIDSSLLELKYLSYLDLSGNDFQYSSIPAFLGSMKQLQYLNLAQANFSDIVPHQLGNLSSLRRLDLGQDGFGNGLRVDGFTWAGNLSLLGYLDMSGVDLSTTKDIMKVLDMLPSLVFLSLSNTRLDDTNLPHANCLNRSTLLFTSNVKYLDLSSNSFGKNPSFCLHNMTSLSILDLSLNFISQKTDWISDLVWDNCHLKALYLGDNQFYGDISGAFKNLSGCWGRNLESLDLEDNAFIGYLPEELGELKQLREIYFSHNNLSGPIPSSFGNLRVLRSLDISYNQLCGEIPISLGQLSNLESIIFSDNKLSGPIPSSIGNLKSLRSLDLSGNQLGGEIPISLGQLSNLESILISANNFTGPIPSSIGNLKALRSLDLSYNPMGGEIPFSLGQLSNLQKIHISNFSGHIPSSIGNLRALRSLDLSSNQMGGEIPVSLGQLSNLERINIYSNALEGTLSEAHFAKLSRLKYLDIGSKNGINFRVGDDWVPPFQLHYFSMVSVAIIGSRFPKWLQTQKSLKALVLIFCNIRGKLPLWLGSLMNLGELQLSNNHIEGPIPELSSNMVILDLSRNFILNGSIPKSFCQMKRLQSLDLSRNHLSGHLPDCNWGNLVSLFVSYNQLSGVIPNSIGGGDYCALEWLQLNNNNFTGQIPFTLMNCTRLAFLDIGDNKLTGKLPEGIGNYMEYLVVLRLRNNKIDGDIPSAYCQLSQLQIMDLAHNQLMGNIPHCFGNLSGMINIAVGNFNVYVDASLNEVMKGALLEYTMTLRYLVNLDFSSNRLFGEIPSELMNLIGLKGLNLSHNHLGGNIHENIGDLKSLESLDLSGNNLFGKIPQSISKLTSLSFLNLSDNNLSGPIPTGPQLQTLNNHSSYDGNPGLCGNPLVKKCYISNNEIPVRTRKVENDGGMKDKIYLYAFITFGLATGFWAYFGVLVFKRSWRLALFRRMDVLIAKMLGRY